MALQWRRGLAASFTAQNPVLLDGQVGWERDTKKFKVGYGGVAWNDLEYATSTPEEMLGRVVSTAVGVRRADIDRTLSAGLIREAAKAATWHEDWEDDPDPDVWESAGSPVIVDGVLYGAHCSLRPIEYNKDVDGNGKFNAKMRVSFKTGEAADRTIGAVLTTSDAANVAGGGFLGTYFVGIDATPGNEGKVLIRKNDTVQQLIWPDETSATWAASGDGEWLFGFTMDDVAGLCMYARLIDGTFDRMATVAVPDLLDWEPTKFGILSSDDRGAAGSGVLGLGFRGSTAQISPGQGLEDQCERITGGTKGNGESWRVSLPKTYTDELALPVVIHCHGGRGSFADPMLPGLLDGWNYFSDSGIVIASGDFSVPSLVYPGGNKYPAGAPESINRVVDLYKWLRDRYRIGPVFLTGYSMGGLTVMRAIADGRIPVTGAIVGDPLMNLEWAWSVKDTNPGVEEGFPYWLDAWGLDETATHEEYTAAVEVGDVWKYDPTRFRGVPTVFMTSPDDTTVDEDLNGKGMFQKMLAAGAPVAHWATSGEHGSPTTWPNADIAAFVNNVAFTTGVFYD